MSVVSVVLLVSVVVPSADDVASESAVVFKPVSVPTVFVVITAIEQVTYVVSKVLSSAVLDEMKVIEEEDSAAVDDCMSVVSVRPILVVAGSVAVVVQSDAIVEQDQQ